MKRALIGGWILIIGWSGGTSRAAAISSVSAHGSQSHERFQENKEITDNVLKADTGSLSRYSLRFNLSYAGPPIGELDARHQPNPDGTVAVTATALKGSFGGRYRLDSKSSLSLTAGLSDQYIFHDRQRMDVNNPYFSYQRAFRLWGIQMIESPGIAVITARKLKSVSELASINNSLTAVWDIGHTGLALGLTGTLAYYFFTRSWHHDDGKVRQYNIGLNPSLKYNLTDRLNVYSTLQLAYWNPRSGKRIDLHTKTTAQKFGVGYSFSRDFYITPYLGFFPAQPAWKSTTLNCNTVFSLF